MWLDPLSRGRGIVYLRTENFLAPQRIEKKRQGGRKIYRYGERNFREREGEERDRGKGRSEREIDRYGERVCMFRR